jgi:uncharacterized protein YjbJ (UPF0337 family)
MLRKKEQLLAKFQSKVGKTKEEVKQIVDKS